MAVDIALIQNTENEFDVQFENVDFKLVDIFDTSLTISLFADARALPSQIPISQLRRGWWADQFDDDFPLFETGSRLWLLEQARNNQLTLNNAIDFAKNALQWLVVKNHAISVDVTGSFTQNGIRLAIIINRANSIVETRYFDLWNNTGQQ